MNGANVRYLWWLVHSDKNNDILAAYVYRSYKDAWEASRESWPIYLLRRTTAGATLRAPVSWEAPMATDDYPSLDRFFEGSKFTVPNKYRLEIKKVHLELNKKEIKRAES